MINLNLTDVISEIADGSYPHGTIYLPNLDIDNSSAKKLMQALSNNPKVAANIQRIDLSGNNISSLQLARTLTGLVELELRKNKISFFRPSSKCVNLEVISLRDNDLSDCYIPHSIPLRCLMVDGRW